MLVHHKDRRFNQPRQVLLAQAAWRNHGRQQARGEAQADHSGAPGERMVASSSRSRRAIRSRSI